MQPHGASGFACGSMLQNIADAQGKTLDVQSWLVKEHASRECPVNTSDNSKRISKSWSDCG